MGSRLEHPPPQKFRLCPQGDVGLIGRFVAVIIHVGFYPKDQIRVISEGIQKASHHWLGQERVWSRGYHRA